MTDTIRRDANERDLDGIVTVYRQCFSRNGLAQLGPRSCLRYFKDVLSRKSCRLFVVQEGVTPVGFAILVVETGDAIRRTALLRSPGVWGEIVSLTLRQPGLAFRYVVSATRTAIGRGPKRNARMLPAAERFAGMRTAWLQLIGVDPSTQGRGLGKRMLAYLSEASGQMGFECVKLNVDNDNAKAMGLYERAGFMRTVESQKESTYARECATAGPSEGKD